MPSVRCVQNGQTPFLVCDVAVWVGTETALSVDALVEGKDEGPSAVVVAGAHILDDDYKICTSIITCVSKNQVVRNGAVVYYYWATTKGM